MHEIKLKEKHHEIQLKEKHESEFVDTVLGKGIGRVQAEILFSRKGSKPKIKEQ